MLMHTANTPVNNAFVKNTVLNMNNDIVHPVDSIAIYEHVCEKSLSRRVLTLNLVETTPVHLKGWELVKKRELITMGISLGNGYFNRERLEVILNGMANYFKDVIVIFPDLPVLHTYRALGYDEHYALERMKKHMKDKRGICKQISGQVLKSSGRNNIQFITWSDDVVNQKCYQEARERSIHLYNEDMEFRESVLRNTERYILARLGEQDIHQLGGMKKMVESAAYYLIEELAFHEVLHLILNKIPTISYYRELELISNYVNGKYNNLCNNNIGMVIYNILHNEHPL